VLAGSLSLSLGTLDSFVDVDAAEAYARPSQSSDEQLLLRYRDQSDVASFEALVHRYERELYSYLRRYVGDAPLADDVFQTTFLQVHQKCRQFQYGRRFRPWLYTIAIHQAIDSLRKRQRHATVSFDAQPTGRQSYVL
jgi:RNA polymerase sigma-70 factor (ECF subfamily)